MRSRVEAVNVAADAITEAIKKRGRREPRQEALINEGNLELTRDLVAKQLLRHDADWISNGVWLVRKVRLSDDCFLKCESCLKRITGGQISMIDLPPSGPAHMLSMAKKLRKFEVTNSAKIYADRDYLVLSDGRSEFLLSRDVVEGFELTHVFAPGSKGPAFDAEDVAEITLIIEVFRGGEQ